LVTGPTGSGKTTTLYAALSEINDKKRNILTVEDPIEYFIDGIGQTQVNGKVDMTFARGLRAILRQDPDVVMVGEIRDLETASIAVQASLTGHMVFSTLHTNTAVGAITRMRDMGVEPFLLSSSLVAVLAQRLVRVLCDECRTSRTASDVEFEQLKLTDAGKKLTEPPAIFTPGSCSACNNTGYAGRTGIYELVNIDETMRSMIHDIGAEQQLEQYAHQHTASIRQDGMRLVLEGVTTLEEVMRVTKEAKGFDPLAINQVKERAEKSSVKGLFARRFNSTDLALFTRQLSTLVRSGTPLEEALRTIGKHTEKPRVKRTIMGVRSRVSEGFPLEKAMGEFPSDFPEMYRATIAAGEKSGHLDAVLDWLADYTETKQETQQSVTGALVYPIALLCIAIAVIVLLVVVVVPKIVGIFEDLDQELPLLTQMLISFSNFLVAYGIYILIAFIVGIILFQRAMKAEAFRAKVQKFYLGLPIVGRLTRGMNTARFSRTLSILTASGVPVLDSLRIAAEVIINRPMRNAVQEAAVSDAASYCQW